MENEQKQIEEIECEQNENLDSTELYKITSWGADLSFRELIAMYKENDLLKPELQRKYVWDKSEASRFIDSLLLGLPVPSIFLATQNDDTKLIVDGFQRIMTVFDYVEGIFSGDGKVFKLSKTDKINTKWRGKAFSELDDQEQRKIRNTTIHAIIFSQTHPENNNGMFQIFERINTSGRTLVAQEIRNCIYQGKLNDLLFELNKNSTWRILFGKEEEHPRMLDLELILRFLALVNTNFNMYEKTAIQLKKFLNDFMYQFEKMDDAKIQEFKNMFDDTINKVYNELGESAFSNISIDENGEIKIVNKFNPTIYDSIMIASFISMQHTNSQTRSEKRIDLLQNEAYQDAISIRTTNKDSIVTRINLALQYLYGLEYE